jgi:hypothetical protein
MRIIKPFTVTQAALASSNVPDVPPAAWNSGTTYADADTAAVLQADLFTWKVYESIQAANLNHAVTDAAWWLYLGETYGEYSGGATYGLDYIVISTADDHAYQSLQASNTGHSLSDAAWWLDLGPTNRYRMFDQSNTSQTLNGESIDVTIEVTGRANSVSLLNIVGASLRVVMSTVEDGTLYDETINLVSSGGVTNWWEYFFLPVTRYGDWTINDLPSNNNPTIRVVLTDPDATAKIGSLVVGLSRNIGTVIYPSSIGIQDYSRKEADEFGNYTIVQRDFAKRASLKITVPENNVDALTTILAELRATPVVFVGVESYRATWIYGFYKDWSWQFAGPNESYLVLELEGLT